MNPFSVLALLRVRIDIHQDFEWEDVPLGVGNSHCDTTGNSAPQWEPLDLDGVNILTFSAQICSAMMVVVNTETEAAAASLSSQPLVSASAHTGLWSLCAPEYFYPNSARPGQPRLTPLHQGERKLGKGERGERFPRVMRGRRGESAQHSRVLENGDTVTVAQPAPSLLVLCMRSSRLY